MEFLQADVCRESESSVGRGELSRAREPGEMFAGRASKFTMGSQNPENVLTYSTA
jgi:hypothetical protein